MPRALRARVLALLSLVGLIATAAPASAAPTELQAVRLDEQLGASLPLDARFVDDAGRAVTLGDYFGDGVPVLLTFNYSRCPQLCSVQLDALVDGLKQMEWTAGGGEFRILTIGLDPRESPERARETKRKYIERYGRPAAADGWHFLVGEQAQVAAVADAVGFRYRYDPATDQYMHPAAVSVASPDGRVMRYLYGVLYDPRTVRLSLAEAADGEVGSPSDQIALLCYAYDPESGRYRFATFRVFQIGGAIGAITIGALLTGLWLRERRRRGHEIPGQPDGDS